MTEPLPNYRHTPTHFRTAARAYATSQGWHYGLPNLLHSRGDVPKQDAHFTGISLYARTRDQKLTRDSPEVWITALALADRNGQPRTRLEIKLVRGEWSEVEPQVTALFTHLASLGLLEPTQPAPRHPQASLSTNFRVPRKLPRRPKNPASLRFAHPPQERAKIVAEYLADRAKGEATNMDGWASKRGFTGRTLRRYIAEQASKETGDRTQTDTKNVS